MQINKKDVHVFKYTYKKKDTQCVLLNISS